MMYRCDNKGNNTNILNKHLLDRVIIYVSTVPYPIPYNTWLTSLDHVG